MRIFKVVSIQRNFFNHTRSTSLFKFKCFPEHLKTLGGDNAKSHSVLPRTEAAYKQVFNTWGVSKFRLPLATIGQFQIRYWHCWDKTWWSWYQRRECWQMRPPGQHNWGCFFYLTSNLIIHNPKYKMAKLKCKFSKTSALKLICWPGQESQDIGIMPCASSFVHGVSAA